MTPERHKKETKFSESVIFVLYRDGKVLLERRPTNDTGYPGLLIVPGGKCENDETPRETLKREMEEELGLTERGRIRFLGSFKHKSLNGHKYFSMAYLITDFKGEIQNIEPEKGVHIWLPIEEALREARLGATKYVLFIARKKLNEVEPSRD